MNINRIRFAQARGARIQARIRGGYHGPECWVDIRTFIPGKNDRIHPSDEHLQYGPLSSALIEDGMFEVKVPSAELEAAYRWMEIVCWSGTTQEDIDRRSIVESFTEGESDLFHLFFAEYLADMGL